MDNYSNSPFFDPSELLWVVYFDFKLTGLACLGMVVGRMLALRRYHHMKTVGLAVPTPWHLAIYWPVFVWAIQAISAFYSGFQFSGPHTLIGLLGTWEYAYGGVIALVCVICLCTTTQWVVHRVTGATTHFSPSLPMSAFAAVFSVYFSISTYFLVAIATGKY